MSEEHLENPENKKSKDLLLWYVDRYLPVAAGNEYWSDQIRYYKLLTDTCRLPNAAEENKVLVTVSSEAFGLLILDNCRDKWLKIFKLKEEKGKGAKIPTSGEEAAEYKAKWTKDRQGRVKFGGWDEDGYERFEQLKKQITQIRQNDANSDKAMQQYMKKIMREQHGITADVYTKKSKSRKRTTEPAPQAKRKCTRIDE